MKEEEDAPLLSPRTTKKYCVFLHFPNLITHHIMICTTFISFVTLMGCIHGRTGFWCFELESYRCMRFECPTWWDEWPLVTRSDFGYQRGNVFIDQTSLLPVKKYKHEFFLVGRVLCFYFTMLFFEVSALICFLAL